MEKEEKNEINNMYEKESLNSVEDFIKENNIDINNGLNDSKVHENIQKYGLNQIKQNKPKEW